MEEALIARLRGTIALATLVGNRIDWVERKHGDTLPAIVLHKISAGRRYDHTGWDELEAPRLQADYYAASFSETVLLERAMIAEMESAASVAGVEFGEAFVDSSRDLPVVDIGGGVKVHNRQTDFFLTWANS